MENSKLKAQKNYKAKMWNPDFTFSIKDSLPENFSDLSDADKDTVLRQEKAKKKDLIKTLAAKRGLSVNQLILGLITEEISKQK